MPSCVGMRVAYSRGMENTPHSFESSGEGIVSMEKAREVLAEIAQEINTGLSAHASTQQVATLRRSITI